MARARNAVGMKDVAALAGVSLGTVSNVLNSPEVVSPKTRARVESAIEKLGFVRNESARQLRAGRSRSVGIVVLDLANPFFADVIHGAEERVLEFGCVVQVGNSAQDPDRERQQLDLFEQQRVRGVLLTPTDDVIDRLVGLRRRGIPIVIIDRVEGALPACSVSVDNVEGGRLAAQHLLDSGHRQIAFVGGPGQLQQVRDRRLGAEIALASRSDAALLVISTPMLDVAGGVRGAEEICALSPEERPTGVLAGNDLVALGLLQGFTTQGVRVPDDIAIVGYDDISFAAAAAVPLSSIRQPREELGRRASDLLFDEIRAQETGTEHTHQHVSFAPELIVRRSSAESIQRTSR